MSSIALSEEALRDFDAVIVVTDHSDVDYEAVRRGARLVIDTRGAVRRGEHVIPA